MKIAFVQSGSVKFDIVANVINHSRLTRLAISHKSDIIIFPELSLTGYEPENINSLTINIDDERISPLRELAGQYGITIVAGAPVVSTNNKPNIGALVISPTHSFIYRKNFLHPGEEEYFSAGEKVAGVIDILGIKIGLAICADIDHEEHIENTISHAISIYAAGVLMMEGYAESAGRMRQYSKQYSILTLMANYGGRTGGNIPAGKSAAWDQHGNILIEAGESGESLCIVSGYPGHWSGILLPT